MRNALTPTDIHSPSLANGEGACQCMLRCVCVCGGPSRERPVGSAVRPRSVSPGVAGGAAHGK